MAGLLGAMFTGNTGLQAASKGVSVVGDNIANTNTVGFKASRIHFQEMLQEYIVGASGINQVGRGVQMQRIEKLFTQGALQFTGVPTDLAIDGDGFFVTKDPSLQQSQNQYTRSGQFRFDKDGFLVSQAGSRVQGYNSVGDSQLSGVLTDLEIQNTNLAPKASTEVNLSMNLDPNTEIVPGGFDPTNEATRDDTSNFRTTVVLYDSLGNPHSVEVYGTRVADADVPEADFLNGTTPGENETTMWQFHAIIPSRELRGNDPNAGAEVVTEFDLGTLLFNENGQLSRVVESPVSVPWANAGDGTIDISFGDPLNQSALNGAGDFVRIPQNSGRAGSTLWGEVRESALNSISQDGYGTGVLQNITVDGNGFITGAYNNGQSQILGQAALSRFNDPTGLVSTGGNNFVESNESGAPIIGSPRTGSRGGVVSGSLEASNVELSEEFIQLISYQRAFQANSKTIQTADGLMQEVFQIIR
jgi:flagellar hook protein FlgE